MSQNAIFENKVGADVIGKRSGVKTADVNKVFATIITLMEEGRLVRIKGFGSFEPRIQHPREIKSTVIPVGSRTESRRKVKFAMSTTLRTKWLLEAEAEVAGG
jgi:nucleoid DNA-binding protein